MVLENLKKTTTIGLLLIPVVLQIIWQLTNNGLPIADAGDHFRITYNIYLEFQEGFLAGVKYFFHTGGKPILFSAYASPLMFLAKYNIQWPIMWSLIITQIITIYAYYWLFTFKISHVISALLAAFMVTMPFIFSLQTQFMPTNVWNMWFVLFLATIYRSENLTDSKLSILAGVFLALTILVRPVESTILLSPPLFLYLYYISVVNRKSFNLDILLPIGVALIPIALSYFSSLYNFNYLIGIVSIILFSGILIFLSIRRKANLSNYKNKKSHKFEFSSSSILIEKFVLPVSMICSVWTLFYGSALYGWALDNSFGTGAKTNDQVYLSKSIYSVFMDVVHAYGFLPITTLFALLLTAFLFNKKQYDQKLLFLFTIITGLILIPMLFAYSLTGTSDMRRIYLAIIFLCVGMCFYIFWYASIPRYIKKIAIFTIASVFSVQAYAIIAITSQNMDLLNVYTKLVSVLGPIPISTPMLQKSEDANLIHKIKSLGISDAKIAVFSLGMFTKKVLFQAESLRYITLGIDKSLNFSTMWGYTHYEPYKKVIHRLKENAFQYIILEDLDNPFKDPLLRKRLSSHVFFVHELLSLIHEKGEDNILSLRLIRKFKLGGRFIYFFKVRDVEITATHHYKSWGPEGLFTSKQPGWHVKSPQYPEVLNIHLINQLDIKSIGFLPQDGNWKRGPRNIQIKVSNDGEKWATAASFDNICVANRPDNWHVVKLTKPLRTRFLQIKIFANCGDPDYLTLRGLKIEGGE